MEGIALLTQSFFGFLFLDACLWDVVLQVAE